MDFIVLEAWNNLAADCADQSGTFGAATFKNKICRIRHCAHLDIERSV